MAASCPTEHSRDPAACLLLGVGRVEKCRARELYVDLLRSTVSDLVNRLLPSVLAVNVLLQGVLFWVPSGDLCGGSGSRVEFDLRNVDLNGDCPELQRNVNEFAQNPKAFDTLADGQRGAQAVLTRMT